MCRLKFPVIFTVYISISLLISSCFDLVAELDRENIVCASKNLLENLKETVAPFYCRLLGKLTLLLHKSADSHNISYHNLLIYAYANAFYIPGAMYIYERLQTLLWWLFQNGIMLYGVVRPLQYRSHSDSGKLKYVHLSFLAAGIGLPLIPVLICHWNGGYGTVVVPNYTCLPRNMSATMYCLFLPATVCAIIGLSMLLYIGSKLGIKVIVI